jgi:8-oxo-dGTP diphosphatase
MASNPASVASEDDEQLAVTYPDGSPTGVVKSRAAVHTDGDWHRTRTVWALLPAVGDAGPMLVLQQRGPFKTSWPNRLDASSAGHLRVGDPDPWREAEEELGRRPAAGEVLSLGERQSGGRLPNGLVDLEVQELWLWRCPYDLLELCPPYPEVAALLAVAPDALRRLAAGEARRIPALVRRPGASQLEAGHAAARQLIPGEAPYIQQVGEITLRLLAGQSWSPLAVDPETELEV